MEINNRYIKLCVILFFVFVIVTVVFFCVATLITSLGYEQTVKAEEFESIKQASVTSDNRLVAVIDAGHGGEDPGAVNGDFIEKKLNLSTALYLRDFMVISSCDAVMTRTTDKLLYEDGQSDRKKFYDLRNRLKTVENTPNSFYVGIHMNKFPIEKYHGLQTFFSPNGKESYLLADRIQSVCRLADLNNNRQIKKADDSIYILKNTTAPGVLIECGFISNVQEATKLNTEQYRKKLAFLIFCGIEQWNYEMRGTN